MKLFIIRHGETEENAAGILMGHNHGVLSEKGWEQVKEAAELLKDHTFNHIYSSDLDRCVNTAEGIKELHPDTPITFTKEIRERHFGEFQGKKKTDMDWKLLEGKYQDRRPEGGESAREVRERVLEYIESIYKDHADHSVLFVTHGGVTRQIVAHFAGMKPEEASQVPINNAAVFEIEVNSDMSGSVKGF